MELHEDRDRLVSTAVLRERMEALREQVKEQRRFRNADDDFFKIAEWMLEEFRGALRDAAREYRPTTEAATLTGRDPQTLRTKARDVLEGRDPGEHWRDLLVRREGRDYLFCVSTIPVRRTGELKRAS